MHRQGRLNACKLSYACKDDAFAACKVLHRPQLSEPARKRTAPNACFALPSSADTRSALRGRRETLSRLQAHIIDRHERPNIALIALWINKTTVLCNQ